MWISKKEYDFLKVNAEKNINAECEILKAKENQSMLVARAMEEYSAKLEELDKYKNLCADSYATNYHILSVIKCNCETVNMILTETIKTENGEESTVNKFSSIESFANYMKCFNDIIMKYVKEQLGESNT